MKRVVPATSYEAEQFGGDTHPRDTAQWLGERNIAHEVIGTAGERIRLRIQRADHTWIEVAQTSWVLWHPEYRTFAIFSDEEFTTGFLLAPDEVGP